MKKMILPFLLLALAGLSFTFSKKNEPAALPFCASMKKVLADEPADFASLKGDLLGTNEDGSENYSLVFVFDEFSSNSLVKGKDRNYIEIFNEFPDKDRAIAQYDRIIQKMEVCLAVKGKVYEEPSLDRLQVFQKDKSEIAVIVTTTETRSILILTIERAGKD